ncbi:PepSY-associated TM helix domain-containing protein [Sphingobacterium corticibacterium]|uniref:PepSY domain-containing protein n=1 Tax=Sphingobacterium corticibacterium TaxID=2484746 RepID=A0A4Q6XG34_9SPHI|nr:PepSY-associated TM helix domain-containing protein [Sphingobacterium corticibacterium]RZF58850.1 PepSY domain-containing protein [Sphingobacterium corticibacterium]
MLGYVKFIHRWLGLLSGLVVFIVGVTGACLVFEVDILLWGKSHVFVEPQKDVFISPDIILDSAKAHLSTEIPAASIWYGTPDRSARVTFSDSQNQEKTEVFINPYTAAYMGSEVTNEEDHHAGFFHFMEEGHIHLWLPEEIGRPIVGYGTVVFVIILLTGIIWWYPKKWTKGTVRKSFFIKWNARVKRFTIDLHNVPGFYTMLVALVLAITGLYFSFPVIGKITYWMASGGEEQIQVQFPSSDTTSIGNKTTEEMLQHIWNRHYTPSEPSSLKQIFISIPSGSATPWIVALNAHKISSHTVDLRFYDKYTGHELFKRNKETGEILHRDIAYRSMLYHYNIHLGRVGGRFTQWLMFAVSLVCASLPITGFMIWYQRRWGKKKFTKLKSPI